MRKDVIAASEEEEVPQQPQPKESEGQRLSNDLPGQGGQDSTCEKISAQCNTDSGLNSFEIIHNLEKWLKQTCFKRSWSKSYSSCPKLESKRKAMNRNWYNQKANPALNTKTGNK